MVCVERPARIAKHWPTMPRDGVRASAAPTVTKAATTVTRTRGRGCRVASMMCCWLRMKASCAVMRSEEHTSELQSRLHLVCRLLLEKKKKIQVPAQNINLTRMSLG